MTLISETAFVLSFHCAFSLWYQTSTVWHQISTVVTFLVEISWSCWQFLSEELIQNLNQNFMFKPVFFSPWVTSGLSLEISFFLTTPSQFLFPETEQGKLLCLTRHAMCWQAKQKDDNLKPFCKRTSLLDNAVKVLLTEWAMNKDQASDTDAKTDEKEKQMSLQSGATQKMRSKNLRTESNKLVNQKQTGNITRACWVCVKTDCDVLHLDGNHP